MVEDSAVIVDVFAVVVEDSVVIVDLFAVLVAGDAAARSFQIGRLLDCGLLVWLQEVPAPLGWFLLDAHVAGLVGWSSDGEIQRCLNEVSSQRSLRQYEGSYP